MLRENAEHENKRFVSVGLSLDQDPWVGIEFLKQFGPFDQVLSGGSWLNAGSIAFIVRDLPGQRAIPQLILVERDIEVEDMSISRVNDRLVGRKVGADAILSFAQVLGTGTGAQLPPRPPLVKPGP